MAGIKSYLTPRLKRELVHFIAVNGENYERYYQWTEAKGVKAFSKAYLHNWVYKRLDKIKEVRTEFDEAVRRQSTFDRERRVDELEQDINKLNVLFFSNTDRPDIQLKIIEAKRKVIESISKERGEFMKGGFTVIDPRETVNDLRRRTIELLQEPITVVPTEEEFEESLG